MLKNPCLRKLELVVEQAVHPLLGQLGNIHQGILTGTGATEEIQFPQSLLHSRAVQDSEGICHIRFPNSGSKRYTTSMMAGVSGQGWDSSLTVDQVFYLSTTA